MTASPEVRVTSQGIELKVRVTPGSRRTRISGRLGDRLKLSVAVAPERGRANRAVCELLAAELGIANSSVTVVHGLTSRDKVVRILGSEVARVQALFGG